MNAFEEGAGHLYKALGAESFHLKRDIDCDNALKALNDAIAHALNVNDKAFLPSVEAKWTGENDPFVIVEIENESQPAHDDSHHGTAKDGGH